jgi:spore coat polysaccharide biosynthesis protein SpsF
LNIGIIIQARMGSSRLPGKVLLPISGKTILQHIFERLNKLNEKIFAVVATSNMSKDDPIVQHCKTFNFPVFRGSEANVLDRFYQCAKANSFLHIVRLTADNPFTDIEELKRLISKHLSEGFDYTHSFNIMPIGVGAEIFKFETLEKIWMSANSPNHYEHINEYIYDNPYKFNVGKLEVGKAKSCPKLRLTVDTPEDYAFLVNIAIQSKGQWVNTEEAIKLSSRFV